MEKGTMIQTAEANGNEMSVMLEADLQLAMLKKGAVLAGELKKIIESNGLAHSFGGKRKHVAIEGWTTAARVQSESTHSKVEGTFKDANGNEVIHARAWVKDQMGVIVSEADAYCSTGDEPNWKTKPFFQRASMAQTRALGKALRLRHSWIMVMAGYEATPLEEMDGINDHKQNSSHSQAPAAASPATQEPSKPKPATVADSDTPSFGSIADATAQGFIPVVVKKIAKKTGETNGKKWTRYGIEVVWEGAPEPVWLNTFSDNHATYARRHEGAAAYFKWEEKQYNDKLSRNITDVAEVSNG